jgi:hypothetical protein
VIGTSGADPHHFDADTDPACHLDADPDPAFPFDADPDPELADHFVADPDLTFQFDSDPDPVHNTGRDYSDQAAPDMKITGPCSATTKTLPGSILLHCHYVLTLRLLRSDPDRI